LRTPPYQLSRPAELYTLLSEFLEKNKDAAV